MKKLIIGIITGAVLVGGASYVAAESNGDGLFNFEDMKPVMEEMHPNFSSDQLEEMFNDCHGEDGFMSNTDSRGMMNNF